MNSFVSGDFIQLEITLLFSSCRDVHPLSFMQFASFNGQYNVVGVLRFMFSTMCILDADSESGMSKSDMVGNYLAITSIAAC